MNDTYDREPEDEDAISDFLDEHFRPEYEHEPSEITDEEHEEIEEVLDLAPEIYETGKAYYGLLITFTILAEQLSQHDGSLNRFEPEFDLQDLLNRYKRKDANTFTVYYKGKEFGIRDIHEDHVEPLFDSGLGRTNFPSSAPYTTGHWDTFDEELARTFRLSRAGRYKVINRLIDFGLERLTRRDFDARAEPLPQPFTEILQNYPRKDSNEEAGSAYQAMAYGFVKAEWQHLSLRTSNLRTGSSRQNRLGDIDGYIGPDLMVSLEAKDKPVTDSVVERELNGLRELAQNTGAIAIVMCSSIKGSARSTLVDEGVLVLADSDIENQLKLWDYHKQDNAVQGMIHYFKNVEENPDATTRILGFVNEVDPGNSAVDSL
jgi:hypothetical protein